MNQGLIGNWSPGIGDPTIAGWLTVLLYGAAAWTTLQLLLAWNNRLTRTTPKEHWFWRILLTGLVFLCINKQLDLQSALTEVGRILAKQQGWYASRSQFQTAFIAGIAMISLTLLSATLHLIWGAPASTHWALLGAAGLVLFVIIRAASFHHVDEVLGHRLAGIRINWLLEMGPLLVIISSSVWRRHRDT